MSFNLNALLLAIVFSFLTGLAIQRGGTCTVAAIQEFIDKRTTNRIRALIETALWVLAGELILTKFSLINLPVQNWQISLTTIAGAFFLGVGAFINGACTVGSIARIGNREWDFLWAIPGFFTGAALLHWSNLPLLKPTPLDFQSTPILPSWMIVMIAALILCRSVFAFRKGFQPYISTVSIGILFLGLVVINKAWSYTDLLIDLATFNNQDYVFRLILFATLLAGAIVGGRAQGSKNISLKKLTPNIFRRFLGGALMGAAALTLPGGHDSLVLLYMPLLLGYAWLGFTTMACTILLCKVIQKNAKKSS